LQIISILQRLVLGLSYGAVYKSSGVNIHPRQGELDSTCGFVLRSDGINVLRQIRAPSELTRCRKGKTAAALWDAYQQQYFEGTNAH
jgi:hypothetical protein